MRLNFLGLKQTLGNIDDVYELSGHMVQVFALSYPFLLSLKSGVVSPSTASSPNQYSKTQQLHVKSGRENAK